jgi:hypothetical protein
MDFISTLLRSRRGKRGAGKLYLITHQDIVSLRDTIMGLILTISGEITPMSTQKNRETKCNFAIELQTA